MTSETTERAALRHVFSGIPNDKRHRKAIDALRPFFNHAEYRLRLRGRTKKPGHTGNGWGGQVRLADAQRLSIYIDSEFEAEQRSRAFTEYAARRDVERVLETERRDSVQHAIEQEKHIAALEESRARLIEGLVKEQQRATNAVSELALIPAWIRAVCRFFWGKPNTTTTEPQGDTQ